MVLTIDPTWIPFFFHTALIKWTNEEQLFPYIHVLIQTNSLRASKEIRQQNLIIKYFSEDDS